MKKLVCLLLALMFLPAGQCLFGDWIPDDGHKMHYPQFPDLTGWNVNATNPLILADDWMCSSSGPVTDVHFWGSWMGGMTGEIISFNISIHADIPADPPQVPYSMPGVTLWEYEVPFANVIAQPFVTDLDEGWYDPAQGIWNYPDHNEYWQYNIFFDQFLPPEELFVQQEGTIYWLNISATVVDPAATLWGWKSTQDHWNDDAVFAFWGNLQWVDMYEPPDFAQSLDLAFVINGPEQLGACCYTDPPGPDMFCIQATQADCINIYNGVYQGDGSLCQGMQACCLPDGSCVMADALCCVNELGGNPQGPGTACGALEACCMPDGTCMDLDPLCCMDQGGAPQGPGTLCAGQTIACCLQDGTCLDVDPICCDDLGGFVSPFSTICLGDGNGNGTDDACEEPEPEACCLPDGSCANLPPADCQNQGGTPQGPGTQCSATTIACCLPDGTCMDVDPLCCDDLGGTQSSFSNVCLGDNDGNGTDDACEEPETEACCLPDGSCTDLTPADCQNQGGTPQGPGTQCSATTVACCLTDGTCMDVDPLCCDDLGGTPSPFSGVCLGDVDANGIDDACEEPVGACCFDDGSCSIETAANCNNLNGTYKGHGTVCKGDSDGDGNDDICVDPWPDHKMHYPQVPDPYGWDVNATAPLGVVADDWRCSESGFVKDIHFWGSWMDDNVGTITRFFLVIYSDIPADPPSIPYSRPGDVLWSAEITDFVTTLWGDTTSEGWYDPEAGIFMPDNHQQYFRYDIVLEEQFWFEQVQGTIYWLGISAEVLGTGGEQWGWKTSLDHFNDDATWLSQQGEWNELFEPPDPMFNMFSISMGPANQLLFGFGENAYGEGWYFYPTGWWNIWFYDHPLDYNAIKDMALDMPMVMPTDPNSFITIAFNWSTDLWSQEGNPPGPRRPPLPGDEPEESYIGREIVYSGPTVEMPPNLIFRFPDYNPEWVSVDVMGENFEIVDAMLLHDCRQSLDMAFVITAGSDCFGICGDANNDFSVNVSDAVWIINYVFVGGMAPVPVKACGDANGDCDVNVSDAVWIINFVFVSGPPPGDCCPGGPLWIDGDCCPYVPPTPLK